MRYSFHGKVRATGQQVDGYVEAETSTEAIDRLADQGIIGVYSVRAEPKTPRNSVLLAGTPEFERAQFESPEPPRQKRRALPAPASAPLPPLLPVAAPIPEPATPLAVAAVPAGAGVSDAVMGQLVDKLSILIGQMQKFLDRPAQVIYQSGPAREGGGKGAAKRTSRNISDAQNSTLKDIFQNNLDLRRSLAKLAETVTPTNGAAVTTAAAPEVTPPPPPPPSGGAPTEYQGAVDLDLTGPAEASTDESGHDLSLRVHDVERGRHAQPAA